MSHLRPISAPIYHALTFGSLVGGMLILSPASLADYDGSGSDRPGNLPTTVGGTRAYVPPADLRSPEEDHTGGGVRGCGDDLAAIAPRLNAVGQTAATTPTFVWYNFSDDGDPIEFQLYRFKPDGSFEQLAMAQFETSTEGYMAYTLPADAAELEVGETYLWEVVLYCDDDFEEPGQYSSAEIEVVELPADLAPESFESAIAAAQAYAAAGLWYDALAAVYDATTPEAAALRQDLLLDLADFEEQPDEPRFVDLSAQLREIADMAP